MRSDVLGPDANYLFVTPFLIDPSDPRRLWLGGVHLERTNNGALSWTKASTTLPAGGITSAIAIAPADGNHVVAGSHKGHVLINRQALNASAQTEWSGARPREGWVTSVAIDPRNTQIVYA